MIEMWDEAFSRMNPQIGEAVGEEDGRRAFALMHGELDRAWAEVARVLRGGGLACVNVGDATRTVGKVFRLYANASRVAEKFVELGFDALPKILWRKPTNAPNKFMGSGTLPPGAYVTLEHETILVMRKGPNRTFPTVEDKSNRRESAFFWEERNRWFSDQWELKGVRQASGGGRTRSRSGAYPFDLPYRLINMYSVKGDTVLDPFLGTGTTTLAAMASQRNSVGMEIDSGFEEAILGRGKDLKSELNEVVSRRLTSHVEFVEAYKAKKGKSLHRNTPHGFDVVTRQETELAINLIDEIRREENGFFVVYSTG
jgi:DNA modification methylase